MDLNIIHTKEYSIMILKKIKEFIKGNKISVAKNNVRISIDNENKIIKGSEKELNLRIYTAVKEYLNKVDVLFKTEFPFINEITIIEQKRLSITTKNTIKLKKDWKYKQLE